MRQGGSKSGAPLALKIALSASLIIGIVVGGGFFGIRWIIHKAKHIDIWLEDIETGEAFRIVEGGANSSPRFSPDGQHIVYVHSVGSPVKSGSEIRLYSVGDDTSTTLVKDGQLNLHPSWDPHGRAILYASRAGHTTDL